MAWFAIGSDPSQWEASIHSYLSTRFENPLLLMLDPDELNRRNDKSAADVPLRVFELRTEVILEAHEGQAISQQNFVGLPWRLETGEAERIAVDHIAKTRADVGHNDDHDGPEITLISHYTAQANAIKILYSRLALLRAYVQDAKMGKVPIDHEILRQIQALTQRLPVMQQETFDHESQIEHGNVLLTQHLSSIMSSSKALGELIETYTRSTVMVGL